MRYQHRHDTNLHVSGNILNCADGTHLPPADFNITSNLVNIANGKQYPLNIYKAGDKITIGTIAHTIARGTYQWVTVLMGVSGTHKNKTWVAPTVIVEVV